MARIIETLLLCNKNYDWIAIVCVCVVCLVTIALYIVAFGCRCSKKVSFKGKYNITKGKNKNEQIIELEGEFECCKKRKKNE